MEQPLDWNTLFLDPILAMAKSVVGFIPNLISALLVFALGYLAALLTRELLRLFLKSLSFDRYSQQIQMLPERAEGGEPILTPSEYASRVAYWIVLFSFFLVGLDKLTLRALSLHGGTVVGFALGVLGVSALGVVALLLSVLVHRIVRGTAARAGFANPELMAAIARGLVLVSAVLLGLLQLGIPREILLMVLGVTYLTLCITFILAFGVGGTGFASALLARFMEKKK